MLVTNKPPQTVGNIFWVGGGGEGVTTDEKGVYIQIQNIIVSSKALVLVNCLNIVVHDCSSVKPECFGVIARVTETSYRILAGWTVRMPEREISVLS